MINKQANILFIPSSVSGNLTERQDAPSHHYYQRLIYASLARGISTKEGFQVLGRQLAATARQAYFARQMDGVEIISRVMLDLPLPDSLKSVARYYQVTLLRERSSRRALENLLEESSLPLAYRTRVLQTLWATYVVEGDLNSATILTHESVRIATDPNVCDLLSIAEGARQIAVVHSINGDHKQALADLEKLFPLVRTIGKYYPAAYYDYLNGLAVELGEAGRIDEAEAACSIVLASPFASAYPEWSATRDDIADKRQSATPSIVAINRTPEAEPSPQVQPQRQTKTSKALALSRIASDKASLQRSIIPIPATATTALSAISILDRVLTCIGPRAPPGERRAYASAQNHP